MRKRAAEAGEKIDWAQQPVYPIHINQIAAAYDSAGGADAYERRAALVVAMAISGRSSEVGYLHHDSLDYDEHFGHCFAEVEQVKVGEFKTAALVPGIDMNSCVYDAIGAMMATTTRDAQPPEAVHWLIPSISRVKNRHHGAGAWLQCADGTQWRQGHEAAKKETPDDAAIYA